MAVHTQSLLASERQEKVRGNTTKKVTITEALFEIGGKKKIKEKIKLLEEKCHPGTEEYLEFRRNEGNEIRMLRTCMGRKHDVKQRVNRMMKACFVLKKRLKSSKLTKREQARVVEACAESTALFDAQIRPWHRSEINQIQRAMDKTYLYIQSNKKSPPLIEMAENGVNMFEEREQLGVTMIETKITK